MLLNAISEVIWLAQDSNKRGGVYVYQLMRLDGLLSSTLEVFFFPIGLTDIDHQT